MEIIPEVMFSVNEELERLRGLVAELMPPNSEGKSTTLSEPSRVANADVVAHMNAELAALRQERDALQASMQALRRCLCAFAVPTRQP